MAEKLGKIKKPSVKKFKKGRKIFFVPLIITPFGQDKEFMELFNKYWEQAKTQVINLEEKLNKVSKIYHELVTSTGEEGIKTIEKMNTGSYDIVKSSLDKGASIQPIEDGDVLLEFMDWSRCLSVGLQNQKVFSQVYQSFLEAQKRRNEHIAKKIDETLKSNEIGILLMREGHQVQFASDIQVFYVAPPGLDEIRRWFQKKDDITQEKQQEKEEKKAPETKEE
ncbi:MAG: hypothetical protein ABH934_02795 [Chloroflexota bacterium]